MTKDSMSLSTMCGIRMSRARWLGVTVGALTRRHRVHSNLGVPRTKIPARKSYVYYRRACYARTLACDPVVKVRGLRFAVAQRIIRYV